MKFARTIQLDVSDVNSFPLAAESGEWALTGTFAFAEADPATFTNKEQLAFRNGWLGARSLGRATFVEVAIIPDEQLDGVVRRIAGHLHEQFGAPDMLAALDAARQEVDDMVSLCDHPAGTLLSIERAFSDDGISETVRVMPRAGDEGHAQIWTMVDEHEE
jgi:hypothetical protein